jgi:hypothetical protein
MPEGSTKQTYLPLLFRGEESSRLEAELVKTTGEMGSTSLCPGTFVRVAFSFPFLLQSLYPASGS